MKPSDFLSQTWQMLQGIIEESAGELAEIGLYPRAFFLLSKVSSFPYPKQLAETLLLPAPTVSFIVKQLEREGFLSREIDRADLRRYRLTLTEKGRKALSRGNEIIDRHAGKRTDRLTKSQLDTFEKLIAILDARDRDIPGVKERE